MPGTNAIAKDTVIAVGGLGTQADKAENNGGGATKTAWDANAPTDFIAANGGPTSADTGITFDFAGGTPDRKFSKAGIGTGVTVGTLAFVSGTNITTGIYEITSIAGDDSWVACANITATDDNADSVMNIGGAIDSLQNALDGQDAVTQNRYIYDNISTETIAATIDVDTFGGSVTTRVRVIGYNSTLAAEDMIIITTDQDLGANALLKITTVDFIEIANIDFNCGGKDNNLAGIGVSAIATGDGARSVFCNCIFRGAEVDGAAIASNYVEIINCEFHLNGRYGFFSVTSTIPRIRLCSIHDNDNHGINLRAAEHALIENCLIYDNGKDGSGHGISLFTSAIGLTMKGNTIHGNANNGIEMPSGSTRLTIFNNTCVGNGGFGYDFNGDDPDNVCYFFGYNHSSVNTTAHTDAVADGAFAALLNGNNQADSTAAASIFTSVADGAEDFTPKAGVDLVDNALDAGTA